MILGELVLSIAPLMFQVPNLKVLGLSLGRLRGAASESGSLGEVPDSPLEPDCWAAGRAGRVRDRRLVVGAPCTPGDAWRRRFLRLWLPSAPEASPPSGGVPAVLPPSPSALLPLSEVPTACAGREEASLNMGVSNPGWEERGSLPGGLLQAGTDTTPGGYRIAPLDLRFSKQYIKRSLAGTRVSGLHELECRQTS